MLGHSSSEKTATVLGKDKATPDGEAGPPVHAAESDATPGDAAAATSPDSPAGKRPPKGHGRIPTTAYSAVEPIAVPHETLHRGDACPECARGALYRLPDPARIARIFGQAPLIALLWECDRLRCGACGKVYTARPPEEARGPKYSESAVSMMALLRYGTGMPLNRLEGLQRSMQIPLPSSTQWQVVLDQLPVFQPVYDELVGCAADGEILHDDDTYVNILELKGKRRAKLLARGELDDPERTGLFTTAIVSVTKTGPIALFFSGRKHAGENLKALMDERDGRLPPPILMSDALARNLPVGHTVIETNCLAHGRRNFVDEATNFPDLCGHVLEELGKVFANEKRSKKRELSGDERLLLHQNNSAPVMDALQGWMQKQLDDKHVEPNSGLGQAFNYMLKRWDKLTAFLRVCNAPLENNICERALKKAIAHRNASLFYRSLRGAHVGDVYMALIYTADLHAVNPFEYLTTLQLHDKAIAANPSDWLPWNYAATLDRIANAPARAA